MANSNTLLAEGDPDSPPVILTPEAARGMRDALAEILFPIKQFDWTWMLSTSVFEFEVNSHWDGGEALGWVSKVSLSPSAFDVLTVALRNHEWK